MSTPNARFIARAYIDNQKVDMADHWVVLQSTTPGNCQITVNTKVKQHAIVAVDLGWGDMIDRVFIGYVERVMPAVNGWYTLFCRELSASLALNYSVMLRHPTLKQVLDELSQLTGLEFLVPDSAYADTAIPCFYCDSSGYAMLDNIGRSFRIDDFIWQQQGNGKIYVGSYQDSFWADKPIVIQNRLMTNHQAGRTATIPAAPMIRPNVLANGSRIKTVEFKETQMTITW
ncbi:hypothetical protein EGC79_11270 [Shewanella vesiculosa]|uniref:hypothetical protein n=1 Tax=Shewanella vesiculosa TaxID=518738 RepID=UPI000F4FE0DE|nr:hypothetical protein [Shewanella vesiculosa]RPA50663.1 hypothetical protein EGC79_11270 [Shewanella vesiculosa]UJL44339.1 hypothetical protein KDH10_001830 [Shewanella vesiculosa]